MVLGVGFGHVAGGLTRLRRIARPPAKSNRRSFDCATLRSGKYSGWVRGIPPLRQKKGAKMGHGISWWVRAVKDGFENNHRSFDSAALPSGKHSGWGVHAFWRERCHRK